MANATEQRMSKKMMSNPDTWPHAVLPLKNRTEREAGGWPKLGYMVSGPDVTGAIIIHLGNFYFTIADKQENPLEFASVDDALAAGWVVD
jgi:hypothetical protein